MCPFEKDEIDIPGAMRPRTARGAKADPHRVPRFRSALLSRMNGAPGARPGERSAGEQRGRDSSPGHAERLFSGTRRCIVKARYVPMNAYGREAARLHLKYLERDGVERDGSPGRLYGASDTFDASAVSDPLVGERNQFRFIVSPEDARGLDLTTYARDLMRQVEADLGRGLVWAAVNHYNTDQPHVHIVVRGLDRAGKQVRLPPQYISHGMRESAERLLTRKMGLRSEVDIARQRGRDVGSERFTPLDRAILALTDGEGRLSVGALRAASRGDRTVFNARLATLERLGVAHRHRLGWRLADGAEKALRELGERHDMVERMARAVTGELGPHRILDGSPARPLDGVVRGKGLHDELAGTFFAAVAVASGETLYVRLPAGAGDTLEVGDVVRLGTEAESWVKPNDRVIAKFASLNGGIYDPPAHEQNLLDLQSRGTPSAASPAALIAANVRRLERLAKYGLAERLPAGRWQVASDLVQQLEKRQLSGGHQRLRVTRVGPNLEAQIAHPGPTWLDRSQTSTGGIAGFGFGAQLTAARRARAEVISRLGLDLRAADVQAQLQALEVREVARALAARSGHQFVPAAAGAKGLVTAVEPLPSGNRYVAVVDEGARRFTLLPTRADGSSSIGRRAEVRASADGRLELRPVPERSRGGVE
jgi:type IV secretory pathway VirD2 relaxase